MIITINEKVDLSFDEFKAQVGHKFKGFVDGDKRLKAEYERLTGNKVSRKKEKPKKKEDQETGSPNDQKED